MARQRVAVREGDLAGERMLGRGHSAALHRWKHTMTLHEIVIVHL